MFDHIVSVLKFTAQCILTISLLINLVRTFKLELNKQMQKEHKDLKLMLMWLETLLLANTIIVLGIAGNFSRR